MIGSGNDTAGKPSSGVKNITVLTNGKTDIILKGMTVLSQCLNNYRLFQLAAE